MIPVGCIVTVSYGSYQGVRYGVRMGQVRYKSIWGTLLEMGVDGQCIACFISYLDWPPRISISPIGTGESHYYFLRCTATSHTTLHVSDIGNGLDILYSDTSPCIHFIWCSCCLLMFHQHVKNPMPLAYKNRWHVETSRMPLMMMTRIHQRYGHYIAYSLV